LKVIQLLRSSPFGIECSYLLCFRFQLFKPSLPIPTAEFRIKSRIHESIPSADVFLFGSRVDDSAKGGDIDLLLLTEEKLPLVSINRIRRLILNDIGEQKIDIVNFTKSITHPFKSLALESAIRL
jgi:predicted nucleotidyltransferase